MRYQYFFVAEKKLITHYVGDHTIAVERPHGNATKSTHPFIPSSADVLTTLQQQSRRERPTDIYRTLTSNAPRGTLAMIDLPRNVKQVRNVRAQLTRKLSTDLAWNAHLVNNELRTANSEVDFIRRIDTFRPDAYYLIGIDEGVQAEFKSMARRKQPDDVLVFMYDTSFNAGGTKSQCLVSHLIVEHDDVVTPGNNLEEERPSTLVLSSLIHQRKTRETHTEHMTTADLSFDLSKLGCRSVVVSDKEFENLRLWEGAQHALCWWHLEKDVAYQAKEKFRYG